jgi:hypothetical protein
MVKDVFKFYRLENIFSYVILLLELESDFNFKRIFVIWFLVLHYMK